MERHHTATAYVVSKGHTLLLWHSFLKMGLPPGGHCEANEHPVETAIREAKEETDFTIEIMEQKLHREIVIFVFESVYFS